MPFCSCVGVSLTHVALKREYSRWTQIIRCLLVPWFLVSPDHQRPRYNLCEVVMSLSSVNLSNLTRFSIGEWCNLQSIFRQNKSAWQELTLFSRLWALCLGCPRLGRSSGRPVCEYLPGDAEQNDSHQHSTRPGFWKTFQGVENPV